MDLRMEMELAARCSEKFDARLVLEHIIKSVRPSLPPRLEFGTPFSGDPNRITSVGIRYYHTYKYLISKFWDQQARFRHWYQNSQR